MKTKFIFPTKTKEIEKWTDLPVVPRIDEWINTRDILKQEEIFEIKQSAQYWSGIRGIVKSVEYRRNENEFFAEIYVLCDDCLIYNKNDKHAFQWKFILNLIKLN